MIHKLKTMALSNWSYKVIALFVSLVLWVTLLGRKDLTLYHTMELQVLLKPNHVIINRYPSQVKVQVVGPRSGLKKFIQSGDVFTLNLEKIEPGRRVVRLAPENLTLPLGVKVLSLIPTELRILVREVKPIEESK